ncbi:MAG: DsbA family protein [bacterium]|nr:DsbA family protein [bacterium]
MNNKVTPILITVIIVAAFAAGLMWTKSQTNVVAPKSANQEAGGATGVEKMEIAVGPNDPVKGNPEAKIIIVEFSDFQCPFCGFAEPTLRKIFETYPDQVKLVYKNYPLPSHENAENAALAVLCAKDQGKYWDYHDKLFENQESLKVDDLRKYAADLGLNTQDFNSCLESKKHKSQIEADVMEANRVGIQGTPAFFINGRSLYGAQPFEKFQEIIEEELKK